MSLQVPKSSLDWVDRGGGKRFLVVWIVKHGGHYSVGEAI
jgi:hypothetical protein